MATTMTEKIDKYFEVEFPAADSSVFRDLLMNLKKLTSETALEETDRLLALLAVSASVENKALMDLFAEELADKDLTEAQIREGKESAAIMKMLNTYYKFKSYLPESVAPDYTRAGLRMQSLMKPQNGKERFEMMAFAVSVVNGCPSCIASHEQALRGLGLDPEKIHDLARIASVVAAVTALKKISF